MISKTCSSKPRWLWRVFAVLSLAWALFVLWGCLNETGASGGLIVRLFPFLKGFAYLDKLVHAGLHGVLASLLWWAGVMRARAAVGSHSATAAQAAPWSMRHALAIVLFCAAYGGVIELLQAGFTTTRGAEWLDELANTTGATLAVLFWQSLRFCCVQKR